MSTFILVRHGWTDWAALPPEDSPDFAPDFAQLCPAGREYMSTVAERLETYQPQRLVSSPLTRALQSAGIVAQQLSLPFTVDEGLREWQPDLTSSRTGHNTFKRAFDELIEQGGEWSHDCPTSWEPLSQVRRRARRALGHITETRTVVLTHSVVIYALTGNDLPPGGFIEVSRSRLFSHSDEEPSTMADRGLQGTGG